MIPGAADFDDDLLADGALEVRLGDVAGAEEVGGGPSIDQV